MSEPMAVEAPSLTSDLADRAGVPHPPTNGSSSNPLKRAASPTGNGNEGANKKPKPSTSSKAPVKKRNLIVSSDEEDDDEDERNGGDVEMSEAIAQPPKPINPDAQGHVHTAPKPSNESDPHPHGIPPTIDQRGVVDPDASSDDEGVPLAKKTTVPTSKSKPVSAKGKADKPSSSSSRKPASGRRATKPVEKDQDSSSEEEKPLMKQSNGTTKSNGKGKKVAATKSKRSNRQATSDLSEDDDEDDEGSYASGSGSGSGSAEASSSEDEKPLAKTVSGKTKKVAASKESSKTAAKKEKAAAPAKKGAKAKAKVEEDDDEEEDVKPVIKAAKKGKGKEKETVDEKPKGKARAKKEEEGDDDELFKWWEADNNDGSVKWNTLEHNGVMFPPPYVPLPKNVKMKYDGVPLTLQPEPEEVAGFFAALLETEHAADKTFRANFFRDWLKLLDKQPPAEKIKVKDIEKCDFRPMFEYFEIQKERKKQLTAADKKQAKMEREAIEKPYLFATIDGRKEKIGNFRVEPPALFRGRGEHPKKGTHKYRLRPEDIVINIGKDAPLPVPNIPGTWKEVVHDNTVTWLAHWKENVNGNSKYVFLSAGSTWKGQSDRQKFEKAKTLQQYVDVIRKDYTADLKSKVMADRQRATAMYLIDRLALRAGNEKGEEEADTVGCCSLRLEHVTLIPPLTIELRFLGKDSIMYEQEVEVDPQVFKNIKIFKADPKTPEDDLFDRLTTAGLNKHLGSYMEGLTAKVFRTYNASYTFQDQLRQLTPSKGTVAEKIAAYNKANKEVAILCNHQKTVSRTHGDSMAKLGDKLLAIKYQRMRLRYSLFALDPKMKKKHPELVDMESDLEDDFFKRHEKSLLETNIDKARKKFEKDNAKLQEEGQKPQKDSVLNERIQKIKEENTEMIKERKTKKVEASGRGADADKILANIKKLDDRIETSKVSIEDRESNKTVALGTSKINYIDPRLTVAWAKKYEVPLEKLFSKTLIQKFPWAIAEIESDPDWTF